MSAVVARNSAGSAGAAGALVSCAARTSYLWLRDRTDRFVALFALAAVAPLLLILAWLVRRDGHPALFCQTRAGLRGRPFTVLKFRTMRPDVDPFGDSPQTGADPRITAVGRWLRESSLDELPQLINVVRGEMALVGPRPLYLQQMAEWDARQRCRLLVKPGLTGRAQTSGRGGLTIEEKLELDVQYVQTISLRTDWWLMWQTTRGLWRRDDVYEVRYSLARERRSTPPESAGGI